MNLNFFGFSIKKIVLVLLLLSAVIFLVDLYIINTGKRTGYFFEKVQKSSLTEMVSESGTITSNGNIPLFSPTNGTVSEIYVKNEQQVVKGQQLFKVVSSSSEQEQQAAYANYLSAKTAFDAAQANLYALQSAMFNTWKIYTDLSTSSTYENSDGSPKTENRILPEFTTAQADWLAAEANYKNQQGVIAKDQAALTSAYTAYTTTQTAVVNSPIDGIVSNISVSKGSTVYIQTLQAAKPILLLKNSDELEAVIPVGQTNIAKVEIGQEAVIKPDAYKDKEYSGKVVKIDSIGENVGGVVTYNVYVQVEKDKFLKPGMTVDIEITTKKLENVLTVPNSAVVLDKGIQTVRVFQKNTLLFVPVAVGVKGETRTQILSGVSEGQEIVAALTNEKAQRPGFLGL